MKSFYKMTEEEKKNYSWQGGFSDEVHKTYEFQNYAYTIKEGKSIATSCCGYIGSSSRTKQRDQVLESFLRKQGMTNGMIATWLTSTYGRHFMDSIDKKTTLSQFEKRAAEYARDAFIKVVEWSVPGINWENRREFFNTLKKKLEEVE